MIWQDLFVALALVMVWEGLIPTLNPAMFRQMMSNLLQMDDRKLRIMGLVSMSIGAFLVYLIKN